MNNLFFACCDCKIYIDAGYRWAYWKLADVGIVARRESVNVDAVLAAENYWNPPGNEDSRWLYEEVFPPLLEFLRNHKNHQVVFGEEEEFAPINDNDYFDWMQIGYSLTPTPRYLVEVLCFKSWDQVREYMEKQKFPSYWWETTWWGDPSPHEKGKRKFEELIKAQGGS